jgi:hopene-associated glycosyltransferase HpnB
MSGRAPLLVGLASAAVWLGLAGDRSGFWRVRPRLDEANRRSGGPDPAAPAPGVSESPPIPATEPEFPRCGGTPKLGAPPPEAIAPRGRLSRGVVAVVPARNEAAVLRETLPALLSQAGLSRVVLVDDRSEDETAALACRIARDSPVPLEVVAGRPTPRGWAGKPWALAQGVHAALATGPEWLWLTDADIHHGPGVLADLLERATADERDLVSVMARLGADSCPAAVLVPAFVYFFALLYPFARVARPEGRPAAAGGCILLRSGALARAGGIPAIAGAVIDDLALARAIRRNGREGGGRLWLGYDERVVSRRRDERLRDLWRMIARSADEQLHHSLLLTAAAVGGLVAGFAPPVVATTAGLVGLMRAGSEPGRRRGGLLTLLAGGTAWATMSATYLPLLRHHRVSPALAPSLPLAASLYLAMTLDSARRHRQGRPVPWREPAGPDQARRGLRAARRARRR